MFDFFKKNKLSEVAKNITVGAIAQKAGQAEPALKEPVKADNVAIHVMPENFRNQTVKHESAKTTGLFIIVGGALILILVSGTLYYFLFRKSSVVITEEPSLITNNQPATEPEPIIPVEESPVVTEPVIPTLPSGESEVATTTTATTTPEIPPIVPAEPSLSLQVGVDSDNDGLTDMEEILLSTNSSLPDTDGDGYPDGSELINLYNPAGAGKLSTNSNISLYENKTFGYDLLYPTTWQISVNGGDDSLMFKTGDNQFIQIIVQPNVNKETLEQWYMTQIGVPVINEGDRVSGSNWQGIKSPDGLNVYIMDKNKNNIFSLTYSPGGGNILEYSNIFQAMIKSFNLKD